MPLYVALANTITLLLCIFLKNVKAKDVILPYRHYDYFLYLLGN